MSYNPYARYTYGGSLYHGRKSIADGGARNGYSNTPGYRPTGKKAVGRIVGYDRSGHPIYAYTNAGPTPWSVSQQFKNAQIAKGSDARDAALRKLNQQQENRRLAADAEARRNKRIGEAVATRSGQRGRDEREAQQRKGDRIIANERGNTLRNKVGKAQLNVSANVNKAKNNAGNWLDTTRRNVGNWFDRRGDEARATINTARKNVGNWFDRRGDEARNTINSVRNAVGNAWDGKAGRGNAKDSYEALNNAAMNYLNRAREMEQRGNTAKAQEYRDKYHQAAAKADKERNAYNNSISGRIDAVRRNAGNWFDRRGDEAREFARNTRRRVEEAWDGQAGRRTGADEARRLGREGAGKAANEAQDRFNRSIVGRASTAARNVRNAVSGPARNVRNATMDASEFVRNTVGNASQKIRSVGEYAKLRANEIRSTISNLPSNVKKQADQIIGDIRSGKTVSEIKAKEIELTNLINNAVGGGFTMPSDSYLNKIDPKKKK